MSNTSITIAANERQSLVPLIESAMRSDVDPQKLQALLAVRQSWEADEARKAFSRAITEFQRRAPIIPKDDKAYDKAYARIDRIWRTVRPLLTELGLSVTWQVCELRGDMCHCEGMLRHSDGHGERLAQDIPMPDLIKGQNKAQQMGSASTYAKRYAMCAALGIVTGDDDDGTAAGVCYISQEQGAEIAELLDACRGVAGFAEDAFWRWLGLLESKSVMDIRLDRYADTVAMLRRKLAQGGAK
jgi:hypothetical protein